MFSEDHIPCSAKVPYLTFSEGLQTERLEGSVGRRSPNNANWETLTQQR